MELAALLPLLEPLAVIAMLAMARAGGLLLALPSLAANTVPRTVRAVIVIAVSVSLVGIAAPPQLGALDVWSLAIAMFGELVIGLALGFVVQIVLGGIRMAGEIIGVEIGLSFSAVADPANPGSSTAPASLLGHLGVQLLFALGIDRALVWGLARSLQRLPLGAGALTGDTVEVLSQQTGDAFAGSLHLALPVMGAVLVVKLALAVLARFVPKLQIFSLAFAVVLAIGLNALHQALPGLAHAVAGRLWAIVPAFERVLASFGAS
ncbi:MAG: flagellar biosynthetic protein FliR [Deltaproteobacteria bacterium]|nr:flagellar biosynthetic protein FliR [Nannocystaceae bacterium]